ncbi:MAG: biopolymer transporter ExbD [Polyangiaceae bacterium]
MRVTALPLISAALLTLAGCGSDPAATSGSASAKPTTTQVAPPVSGSTAAKSDALPEFTVDELGPYINGQRPLLKEAGGAEKLTKIISEINVADKEVPLTVRPKSKAADVVAVVHELGLAKAKSVQITGSTRGDLPGTIVVLPQARVPEAPGCSVVAMITKSGDADVWWVKGGAARKIGKGISGVDLTRTGETMQRELKQCASKYAFFSPDEGAEWVTPMMIAGTLVKADAEKKLEAVVLLDAVPTPGKPVDGIKQTEPPKK